VLVTLKEYTIITKLDIENSRVGYTIDLGGDLFSNNLDTTLREVELGLILGSTFYSN